MQSKDVIGLIPAAGYANRLGPLPCSKELFPIVANTADGEKASAVKVVLQLALERMRHAGIRKAYLVLRRGKWDIPSYLADGNIVDMHLAYLMLGPPFGVPYTLDQAYPFIREFTVALGFGDHLFDAADAYNQLLNRQSASHADVVLGLFPADRPEKVDMVELAGEHRVRRIIPKPLESNLHYTWGNAVWTPSFTAFLHSFVEKRKPSAATTPEPFVGDVIQAAIEDGLKVEAVRVSSQPYIDIGTPEDLAKAISRASRR